MEQELTITEFAENISKILNEILSANGLVSAADMAAVQQAVSSFNDTLELFQIDGEVVVHDPARLPAKDWGIKFPQHPLRRK